MFRPHRVREIVPVLLRSRDTAWVWLRSHQPTTTVTAWSQARLDLLTDKGRGLGHPKGAILNKRARLVFLLEDSKRGLSKGRRNGDKAIWGSFGGRAVITPSCYGIWDARTLTEALFSAGFATGFIRVFPLSLITGRNFFPLKWGLIIFLSSPDISLCQYSRRGTLCPYHSS